MISDGKALMVRTLFAAKTVGATLTALGSALFIVSVPAIASTGAAAPPGNPPGNNGTVKVDGVDFDDHPNNQPHVGCTFQIDFYGYDEGDLNATVTFEDQAPTADAGLSVTSGQGNPSTVFIGEDDNSGAGTPAGLDASETYTLAFTGEPHPVQGYHVKLTINAEGSQGADVKHKVFWVTECAPPTTTTTTPPTSTTPTTTTVTTETTPPTTTITTETTPPTTTVPSSTAPTTSTVTTETTPPTTTVPSSTAPTTSTKPPSTPPIETTPPSSVAPSTTTAPPPGLPTDFDAGVPGTTGLGSGDSGVASSSPWALAGLVAGLVMAGSGLTVLVRRRDDAA